MHNRNTYGDQRKPPNRQNTTSRERQTMMNESNTFSMSNARQQTKEPHQNQTLVKNILEVLQLVSSDSKQRQSYSNIVALKPNQKTLITTISTLLHQFDDVFEPQMLELDMIPDILKLMGYPGHISKNIFNPVGAPHTWSQCLQLMNWLAQLAHAHYELKINERQMPKKETLNQVIIKAFNEDDYTIAENYVNSQTKELEKQLEASEFQRETLELACKNLNNQQKDISILEAEEKQKQAILFREREKVIEIDQENDRLRAQIMEVDQRLVDQANKEKILVNTLEKLRKEVHNQQLSVEEAEQLDIEIRHLENRLLDEKKRRERIEKQFLAKKKMVIEAYAQIEKTFLEHNREIELIRDKIPHQGLAIELPIPDRDLLFKYMGDKSPVNQPEIVEKIWKTEELHTVNDNLISMVQLMKTKSQDARRHLAKIQATKEELTRKKEELDAKIKCIKEEIDKLAAEGERINYANFHIQHENSAIRAEIQSLETAYSEQLIRFEQIKAVLYQRQNDLTLHKNFIKQYAILIEQKMSRKRENLEKHIESCDNMVKEQSEAFESVNGQLAQYLAKKMDQARERESSRRRQKKE